MTQEMPSVSPITPSEKYVLFRVRFLYEVIKKLYSIGRLIWL